MYENHIYEKWYIFNPSEFFKLTKKVLSIFYRLWKFLKVYENNNANNMKVSFNFNKITIVSYSKKMYSKFAEQKFIEVYF